MAATSKKKVDAAEEEQVPVVEKSLEELILNKQTGKYQVVELISYRSKHLRTLEEFRHLTQTEVLELAMRQVLSGDLDEAELTKQMIENPASSAKKDSEKSAKKK